MKAASFWIWNECRCPACQNQVQR